MNILFVHEVDWLRKVVFEVHTLSERLSLLGHKVYAVDYESMWERDHYGCFWSLRTTEIKGVARAYTGAIVDLTRPGFVRISGVSRLSAFVSHQYALKRIIEAKSIDVVVLYSVPTNGLQAINAAHQAGIPVVFRSIDSLHELVTNRWLAQLTKFMEKRVYSKADAILTISHRLSDYVTKLGASPDKVRVVPLGVDTNTYRPRPLNWVLRERWGLSDTDDIIVFVGTLPMFSGLDKVIADLPKVLAVRPNARLLIVGDGVQRPLLETMIHHLHLEGKVIITCIQAYQRMPEYINLASVCLNPFPITGATRDIFPTKVIEYMACGKPIVSTPLPGLTNMVKEGQGIVFASENGIGDALAQLLGNAAERRRIGELGLQYVKQTHDYERITMQVAAELSNIVKERANACCVA